MFETTWRQFRQGVLVAPVALVALGATVAPAQEAAKPAETAKVDENKIVIDGSTTVGPLAKAFKEYYEAKNPGVEISVSESGSGNGAKSLINNACTIADMSRFMEAKEFKAAVDNGVLPVAHVIAIDGLAIVVHPSNPVADLKIEQVRDIYMGKIKNWKELGGPDKPIVAIGRETNSGTYDCFNEKVMDKQKIDEKVETVNSNAAVRQRVLDTEAAIGYAGLGFTTGVKALKVNGTAPTRETCFSGSYPISRPLFMFTNGFPRVGSHTYFFVTLYLSEKGQEIVQKMGYVPVTQY